jgi:hypothetical protein
MNLKMFKLVAGMKLKMSKFLKLLLLMNLITSHLVKCQDNSDDDEYKIEEIRNETEIANEFNPDRASDTTLDTSTRSPPTQGGELVTTTGLDTPGTRVPRLSDSDAPETPMKSKAETTVGQADPKTHPTLAEDVTRPPTAIPYNIFEPIKQENITYNMDLDHFTKNFNTMVMIIYHYLARLRNTSPLRHEFKELSELFT